MNDPLIYKDPNGKEIFIDPSYGNLNDLNIYDKNGKVVEEKNMTAKQKQNL